MSTRARAGTAALPRPPDAPASPADPGAPGTPGTQAAPAQTEAAEGRERLLGIGAAAQRAGVSERALRYYQQLGLITPSARTPGGLRRYSPDDLARVTRIRQLQTVLGLNLDEIAVVLRNEDRLAEIRLAFHGQPLSAGERRKLMLESLALHQDLRSTVDAKRTALESMLADLDEKIDCIRGLV
ncbi:MAG TPA: MerR family transcriptional regulator [Streptosporangiaceae bacterium]|jgi:DNA-binding transcriptional MerR regulator